MWCNKWKKTLFIVMERETVLCCYFRWRRRRCAGACSPLIRVQCVSVDIGIIIHSNAFVSFTALSSENDRSLGRSILLLQILRMIPCGDFVLVNFMRFVLRGGGVARELYSRCTWYEEFVRIRVRQSPSLKTGNVLEWWKGKLKDFRSGSADECSFAIAYKRYRCEYDMEMIEASFSSVQRSDSERSSYFRASVLSVKLCLLPT